MAPSSDSAGVGMDGVLIGVVVTFAMEVVLTHFTVVPSMIATPISTAIIAASHLTDAAIVARAASLPRDAALLEPEALPVIAVPAAHALARLEESVAAAKLAAFPHEVDQASVAARMAVAVVQRMAVAVDTAEAVDAKSGRLSITRAVSP